MHDIDAELRERAKTHRVTFDWAEGYRAGRQVTPDTQVLEDAATALVQSLNSTAIRLDMFGKDSDAYEIDFRHVYDVVDLDVLNRLRDVLGLGAVKVPA